MPRPRQESDPSQEHLKSRGTPANAVSLEGTPEAPPRRRRSAEPDAGSAKKGEGSRATAGRNASAASARPNSIRPTPIPRPPEPSATGAAPDAPEGRPKSDGQRGTQGPEVPVAGATSAAAARLRKGADPSAVPQAVRDRFIQDGRRYYFPDGAPAFKDLGKRLTTQSENTEVVHSLVEIAQARGWSEVTVSGTERFRQEAWRQARLAGLEVRGYRPTAVEQAQLVRALAGRAGRAQSELPLVGETDAPNYPSRASSSAAEAPADAPRAGGASKHAERIVGKLLDHGRDTYRHDPHEEPSYFVRIETPTGKREIWGLDLERAMSKSLTQPQIGEEVALQRSGREPVTVKRHERSSGGEVLTSQEVRTFRNRWVIERSDFFEGRAAAADVLRDSSIAPQQGVRHHPELAGTYLNLKAAEIAARSMRDPEDQKRFVTLIRNAMADQIERGEPLQPVRLRERDSRSVPRDRESIQARG